MWKEIKHKITCNGKITFTFIRLFVFSVCLVLILNMVDVKSVANSFQSLAVSIIIFAVGIYILQTWFVSLRWRILIVESKRQMNQWQFFHFMMISNFFNLFMPGALGGDLARGMLIVKRLKNHRGVNLIAIMADRVVGFFSILVFGLLSTVAISVLPEKNKYLLIMILFILGFVVVLILFSSKQFMSFNRRIFGSLGTFGDKVIQLINSWQNTIEYYREHPGKVLLAFSLCIPIHISTFIIVYLFALNLGIKLPFLTICTITTIAWIMSAIPISFSGLGVRELSYAYLFSLQGIPSDQSIALALSSFGAYVIVCIMGAPFIFYEFSGLVRKDP